MTHNGDALSRFRGVLLQDVTSAQLDSVLGPTSLTPNTADQLEQANLIAQALAAQRCYPHGLAIPELSVVTTSGPVTAGAIFDFRPSGTEIWIVVGLSGVAESSTVSTLVVLTDGATAVITHSPYAVTTGGLNIFHFEAPFQITNTAFLRVINQDLSIGASYNIAYHVVSQ